MKKIALLLALVLLLAGAFAACGGGGNAADIAAYREMESRFQAFSENWETTDYNATYDVTFDLQIVDGAALRMLGTQVVAWERGQLAETIEIRSSGATVFETDIVVINNAAYANIANMVELMIDEMFTEEDLAFFGVSLTAEDLLGEYTHMRMPDEDFDAFMEKFMEERVGLRDAFCDGFLGDHLTRDEDTFRIELEGDAIESYIDAVLEEMNMKDIDSQLDILAGLVEIDSNLMRQLDNFSGWLVSDLTDATLVIERSIIDDTYSQFISLDIPGRFATTYRSSATPGTVGAISQPDHYLPADELEWHVMERLFVLLEELLDADADDPRENGSGELEIVRDLAGLNLISHDLSDTEFLEPFVLSSSEGDEYIVTVVTGGDLQQFDSDSIFWDAWSIEQYYALIPDTDPISVIEMFVEWDLEGIIDAGDEVESDFTIRASQDGTSAFFVMDVYFDGHHYVYMFLTQAVPGSNYVVSLEFVFIPILFGQDDAIIIAELSDVIGIPLGVYLPMGGALARN